MVTAMTIYFKRGVQARIHDARNAMLNIVVNRTAGYYTGNIQIGYEPYYASTESAVAGENTRKSCPGDNRDIPQDERRGDGRANSQ